MNILLWAPFGAGKHYWGPGTSAFRLYQANKSKDVKITLIHATKLQEDFPDIFEKQIKIANIDGNSIFKYFTFLLRSYYWIRKNHHHYDVIHGISSFFYTFLPAIIFRKYNTPVYLKITGESGGFGKNSNHSKFTGFSKYRKERANTLSGYISISTDITKDLLKCGISKEKIHYIPNGVNTSRFTPPSAKEKENIRKLLSLPNTFTCCYIGGLTRNKNVIESVKAIHKLKAEGYTIQLIIVGPDRSSGVIENELIEYINKNSLASCCHRFPHTETPELYYKASDIFILNSKSEGLSNSLLEAMSTGLPCIAHPASGTVDLIEEGINGYLTNGQKDQISCRIKELHNDKAKYDELSQNARQKILSAYSTEFVLQKHLELFSKGIHGNS